jgi:exopolysaccharide biosynthesis WecB/TagA/CpsF family protein
MWGEPPKIEILGVPVACLDVAGALRAVDALYEAGRAARVFYVNAHTLNLAWRDPALRAALRGADLVLNDGSGVGLAARLRGHRFPANLNGTDLNPLILERAATHGWPVFFLGGAPGVAERTADRWSAEYPGLKVAGTAPGFFTAAEEPDLIETIRAGGAQVIMVAMGNPLQERWLERNLERTGARIGVGVGAFFDFSAGMVTRCPAWMSRLGIEWVYRLRLEPGRMWRRYVLGNPLFVLRALRSRRSGGAPGEPAGTLEAC